MAHKASYKYTWGNKENGYLWEKEETLLDIEGEAKNITPPHFLI